MTGSQDRRIVAGCVWIGVWALLASACGDSLETTAPPPSQGSQPNSASAKPAAAAAAADPGTPAQPEEPATPISPPRMAAGSSSASSNAERPNTQPSTTPASPSRTVSPPTAAGQAYPGSGFVVHEWGTNTVVVGSDGSMQRGLQHPGNDLPSFVYDRLSQGDALGFPSVDKMETPVDYFYSERPLSVRVRVDMPNGVLTEWYPAVETFAPGIVLSAMGPPLMDPLMEPDYPYMSQQCIDKYSKLTPGKLDWGTVEILERNAPADALPAAPLDRYTWSHAREVDANLIRTTNPTSKDPQGATVRTPQSERFLFYRGLGNFEPPLRVRAEGGSAILTKQSPWRSPGPAFVMRVTEDGAAFERLDELPEDGSATRVIPSAPSMPLDVFVEQLAQQMTDALSGTGLYRDEALAMVNTWRRQWFRTPGVRVLYFAPQSWIDREIPLTIEPAPDLTVRVMVMRVELLTPDIEAVDLATAIDLNSATEATAAREYYRSLGRFAEPRLRRAISLLGGRVTPEALALLTEIEGPAMSWAGGE